MKCPCCGYNFDKKFNPSRMIQELKIKRNRYTNKLLKKTVNKITTNIPSENSLVQEYYFYQGISHISDDVVDWTLRWYLEQKPYLKGRGFKYVQKMITNHKKNRSKLMKHEELMHGKPPKTVDFSRKE